MERSGLIERLRARLGDAWPGPASPDLADDDAIDRLAAALLERFWRTSDLEAFTLLYELAGPRLRQIAEHVARRVVAVAVDPDDLVATFLARLYATLRPERAVRRFLGFAHRSMRNEALDQIRRFQRAEARHRAFQGSLPRPANPAVAADHRERGERLHRVGLLFLSVVAESFHGLSDRDRRVLLAREVDGLSYDEVARRLELPRTQVGMIIKRAREHLARRVERALARLPDGGGG